MGYSRSQFYEIKRAFQTGGLEALLDKAPIPGSTPHKIPDDLEREIIELSIDHPAWGQQEIADEMALREKVIAASKVRNVWIRNELENRYKRMLELERRSSKKNFKLTEEHTLVPVMRFPARPEHAGFERKNDGRRSAPPIPMSSTGHRRT
jgi:hypothetical protein